MTRGPVKDARGRWDSNGRRWLLSALKREDMNGTKLAELCSTDRRTISALACGENRFPELPLAVALERYGVSVSSWLEAPDESIAITMDTPSAKVSRSPRPLARLRSTSP